MFEGPNRRALVGGGTMARFLRLATAVAVLAVAAPAAAEIPLRYLETEHLRLIYFDPTLTYLAPHVARCFENSIRAQETILGYRPTEKITVLLTDFGDFGNAAAGTVPRNMLQVEVAPMSYAFESFVAPERMVMLMNHELVHLATTDPAAGSDRAFRKLFAGKVRPVEEHPETFAYQYWTVPRNASPRWLKEGIAVFNETWMAGGIGRAQGSYDEMVFRSMVRDDSRFFDPLGLVSEGVKSDFQLEANSYLYGTRFLTWLAYTRTPERLERWVRREPGDARYFTKAFRQVFEQPLGEVWDEWVAWEHGFQEANLARIREYPVTPYRDLSDRALGSVSRAHHDPETRTLYAAFNYPGVVPHVGAISLDDGSIRRILEVKRPSGYDVTSLAWDPYDRKLYFTTDNAALRDLRVVDPATGKSRMLLRDARIGDLAFDRSDRSLLGIRHLNGISTLVRIPPPYDDWTQVWSWPFAEVPYDLDVSSDGTLVSASVALVDGRHVLRVWRIADLAAGTAESILETEFGTSIPMNFVFAPDGASLVGSSYYTGAANLFRVHLEDGRFDALTNAETGFFRPIPLDDGAILAFRYTGAGFVPARLDDVAPLEDVNAIEFLGHRTVERHPALADWQVPSPATVPLEERIVGEGHYKPYRHLGVESLYPVVQGYKDSGAVGLRLNLSDSFALLEGHVTASYTPDRAIPSGERVHLDVGFRRRGWSVFGRWNHADFYDLFGPTKTSLKGWAVGTSYERPLVWDEPREMKLVLGATAYRDLDRLPDYQNVAATIDKLETAHVALRYKNLRGSLGAVDAEKGHKWEIVGTADRVAGEVVPAVRAGYDVGVPLPIRHSSIWLRTAAGRGFGDLEDPFANFFFGGFGNNWVDRGGVRRYRDHDAFPGIEIDEVAGRTFGKATIDWNLPPIRFSRVGGPGFYLSWMGTSLFASSLTTDWDESALRGGIENVGVQFDLRFTVLSNMDMTLSAGYARAYDGSTLLGDEVMVSLNLAP